MLLQPLMMMTGDDGGVAETIITSTECVGAGENETARRTTRARSGGRE